MPVNSRPPPLCPPASARTPSTAVPSLRKNPHGQSKIHLKHAVLLLVHHYSVGVQIIRHFHSTTQNMHWHTRRMKGGLTACPCAAFRGCPHPTSIASRKAKPSLCHGATHGETPREPPPTLNIWRYSKTPRENKTTPREVTTTSSRPSTAPRAVPPEVPTTLSLVRAPDREPFHSPRSNGAGGAPFSEATLLGRRH